MERPNETLGGGGLAFSDDNRWLYATSSLCIFRADLSESQPFLDSLFKRPYYEGESEYVFGTSLAFMQLAPNGKIYMSSQHREKFLSAISIEADSFNYEPAVLDLPVYNIRSIPHFPNFRLFDLTDSSCDTLGIDEPTVAGYLLRETISVFPNPTKGEINIKLSVATYEASTWVLFDNLGRSLFQADIPFGEKDFKLKLPELGKGVYYWKIISDNNVVTTGKLIYTK